MEIFAFNSRHITELLTKFQNKEIDKQKFNTNMFIDIAFNYFYFKKELKKTVKLKEAQNKIFQLHFKKEATQEASEKLLINKVKQKKETLENVQAMIKEQRNELLNNLLQHKDVSIYADHTYNSYIPPKNYSLSLDYHLNNFKEYKKYSSESSAEINYKNPVISNPNRDKIVIAYSEPPYIIDEKNDIFIKNNNNTENSIKENEDQLKNIINYDEDDILFYSEKIEKEDDIKKNLKWLGDIEKEEIQSNFSNLLEVRKNDRTFNNSNNFLFDSNYSMSEFEESNIFDDIPQGGDRYKKFSQYLSDKCYKNYMKKMNYNYLDLMLLSYFDLLQEFQTYNFLQKETIALNFIKKIILSCGICNIKIYEHINKVIIAKKGNFNLENYLDCFTPIFEASDKFQILKYKFLLSLVKNHNTQTLSMENYKIFCNLIKGKWIYEEEIWKKLSKNMIENFKRKYPKEYTDNFIFTHISTIVESLVDKEYIES